MDNALRVQILKAFDAIPHYLSNLVFGHVLFRAISAKLLFGIIPLHDLAAFGKLDDHVYLLVLLIVDHLLELDYIGVIDLLHDRDLAHDIV